MPSILNATTTTGLVSSADNSGSLQLATNNGTTAVTIDTSQNVGIGFTNPSAYGKLAVDGAVYSSSWSVQTGGNDCIFQRTANDGFPPAMLFRKSRGSIASPTTVNNGDGVGNFLFQPYDGSSYLFSAGIFAVVTGAVSTNNVPTSLTFNTGTSGNSERMRIVSNGELGYLCTGLDGDRPNAVGTYKQTNGNSKVRVNGDGTAAFQFYSPTGGGSPVGSITPNASSTTYATSSDYRLKENIAPMMGALAKVSQLKPCTYTWKSNGSAGEGFIAHELQEVVPEAVIGEKDALNEDGSIKPQGIDTSFLVATLTAAIQELNAKVEAQAARIAELEGAK